MDEVRNRYLRDRVMTASPAQRVVMLFDRLALDLRRAAEAADAPSAGAPLGHASSVVAELLGSLDVTAGGPAENLAAIYGFLLGELTGIRASGELGRLDAVVAIVADLREAFAAAAAALAGTASTTAAAALAGVAPAVAPAAVAWVG